MSNHPISIMMTPDSDEPLYVQIREQLRGLIVSGSLPHGEMLPSLRELAAQLDCSLITVRRVYGDLEKEGLLLVRRGTGTFVNCESSNFDRDRGHPQVVRAFEKAIRIGKMYRMSSEEMTGILEQLLD